MATVRGIGVAVMTSTCGGAAALPRRASRCSTPKRCCSSTTTSPRSANCDVLLDQRVGADDDAGRAAGGLEQRRLAGRRPAASRSAARPGCRRRRRRAARRARAGRAAPSIVRACCAASTSVGASSAACPPASTTCSIARSATTVLPEPTSPCSSRCIGCSAASSSATVSPTSRWPAVSVERQPGVEGGEQAAGAGRPRAWPGAARRRGRRCASASWTPSASSHASRRRAAPTGRGRRGGAWRGARRRADIRPWRARTSASSGSGTWSSISSACSTAPRDRPGAHRLGGRVDRDQPAGVVVGVGRRRSRRAAQQQVLGVDELARAAELADLAGEQAARAGGCSSRSPPGLRVPKNTSCSVARAVADDDLEPRTRAAARPHGAAAHLGHDGDLVVDAAATRGRSARRARPAGAGSARAGRATVCMPNAFSSGVAVRPPTTSASGVSRVATAAHSTPMITGWSGWPPS